MAKRSFRSKIVALVIVLLTVSAIVAIVTMVVLYNDEISTMNPTARPTFSPATTGPPPVMRLPKDLVPYSYRIYLHPHMYTEIIDVENVTSPNQTYLVTGNSTVHFHCVQTTATIYLHSKDLTMIGDAVVRNTKDNSRINAPQMIPHNDQSDFLEIPLEKPLEAGENYSVFLAFKTAIPNTMKGMCIVSYKTDQADSDSEDGKNITRYILATQLEPTHAREVFPCFDEPEMKAVFNVTIIHRRGTVALGNADKSGTTLIDDEWQFTTFYPTPKMSTYLFAFTVSEFTATSSQHERVQINTYARPEATTAGLADYAANITGPILSFFEEYSGINYQQNKLDQIAMPRLAVTAMENWGLVTYDESDFLYEEERSSKFQKEGIAKLIAHELAHQWFGNLVTMKWWNQVWLNEGFATYMSDLALAHIEPTFKTDEMFMTEMYIAFEVDALETSHPLNPPEEDVQTLDEITDMFDVISYRKGAVVLRMLADTLDEKVFQKGVRKYLSDLSYKNAEQKDLWECMQMAVNEDSGHINVATMMETWTNQIGYPVVTINTTTGEISQKHFLFNDSAESSLWWYIPIKVMSATSKPTYISLTSSNPERKEELISKDGEWILANVNRIGYYRVNYDLENWERLLNDLETGQQRISTVNRIQLIDDAFSLARAKLIHITVALNSTRYLRNETEFLPWDIANMNMQYLHEMFDRTEVYGPMQAYLRNQVKGLYHHFSHYTNLSKVPEDEFEQQNQYLAIKIACQNGLPECLEMASEKFANWMDTDNNTIPSNLRDLIYCYALATGGEKEWEFAWDKFQNSNDTSDKDRLGGALACTTKIWLLSRYLEYTLDEEKIHPLEALATISYVARNVAGHALAWNFMRARWDDIKHGYVKMLINTVTRRFSTQFELDELKRFAADQDLSDSQEIKQAIERTQVNIKWVGEHKEVLLQWFRREAGS